MKTGVTLLSTMIILLATSAHADVQNDFKAIQTILGSQNVLSKIAPTQTLQSIVRRGDSFDIKLKNADGSCDEYNVMVLGGLTRSGNYVEQVEIDDQPHACR